MIFEYILQEQLRFSDGMLSDDDLNVDGNPRWVYSNRSNVPACRGIFENSSAHRIRSYAIRNMSVNQSASQMNRISK